MELVLQHDHCVNGKKFPRGTHEILDEGLLFSLRLADAKAAPTSVYVMGAPRPKPKKVLPDFEKIPSSAEDTDVKKGEENG